MDELREEDRMDPEEVQMATLVTLLQIRDYLAVLAAASGARQADAVQQAHAAGKLMLDLPYLDSEE